MQQRMTEAIAASMIDGEFVNKFIVIAEVIDTDGDRALWASSNDGATSWDIMGLLQWGLTREMAASQVRVLGEMMEDDDD